MTKLLIIGDTSLIATQAENMLLDDSDVEMTLFLRHPEKPDDKFKNLKVIVGDATNYDDVYAALDGQDIVYASLAGDVQEEAKTIVKAMDDAGKKRLIWTSSLGIYNEIPGEFGRWNQQVLGGYCHRYRLAADVVEKSDLDYTIIRPTWLTNLDEVDYETAHRNDPFRGTEVSRKSVAAYVISLVKDPDKDVRDSVGVDKPGTEGDRPRKSVMLANGGYEPNVKEDIKVRFK
ncbi:NAD(P)H-binding protein [Lactobacillus kitasatonis]|uniref:NAD(P)H-binding protein n=1 Tax=Lactobacillus kitasatonis TaxID=237446 RepID=A0ABS1LRZ6_9LACO|nr:NAD(P)H-binding protein [Lactobacillus kitasatonis]MBL1070970.1 NAD(P)H-binding protein [Lactobacillus kitasatonis]